MARRKHSRALFEVISQGKGFNNPSRPYSAPIPPAALSAARPTFALPRKWLAKWMRPTERSTPAPVEPMPAASVPVVKYNQTPSESFAPSIADHHDSDASLIVGGLPLPPRAENLAVSLDPDRKQIAVRMSYTTAIVAAFALLVIIGLALATAKLFSHPASTLPRTADIRNGPIQPGLLDHHRTVTNLLIDKPAQQAAAAIAPDGPPPGPRTFNEPRPSSTFVAHNANRTANLNYVLMQSYLPNEEKMAAEVCDFFTRNDVPCTIERDVPNWSRMLTVVGIDGFSGVRSPQYRDYMAKVSRLAEEFSHGKNVKKPAPIAVRWK